MHRAPALVHRRHAYVLAVIDQLARPFRRRHNGTPPARRALDLPSFMMAVRSAAVPPATTRPSAWFSSSSLSSSLSSSSPAPSSSCPAWASERLPRRHRGRSASAAAAAAKSSPGDRHNNANIAIGSSSTQATRALGSATTGGRFDAFSSQSGQGLGPAACEPARRRALEG